MKQDGWGVDFFDRVWECDDCKTSLNEIAYCNKHWDELQDNLQSSVTKVNKDE